MNLFPIKKQIVVILLFTLSTLNAENKILPIVLVAGLNADHVNMQPTENYIKKYLPGVYVKKAEIGIGKITSFWNMYDQAAWLAKELYEDPKLRKGCHIIAHSQGGLVARYFIQRYNYPQVHTFITMGSPHQGVFGTPGNLDNKYTWLNVLEKYASAILYSRWFQKTVSFASYWHDTLNYNQYLEKCMFLPYLNNEKDHEYSDLFRENLTNLKNFILINSTNEKTVEPAISCHFGFYKNYSIEEQELFDSDIYIKDKLGLQELHKTGRLHLKMATCIHEKYQEDEDNFVKNILPFFKEQEPSTTNS